MLENKIMEELKTALKSGEKAKVSVIRMLNSAIKNKKIEDRVKELSDEKVILVIQKMARQYKESIEQFKKGKREDLVNKEQGELKILEGYLPEQLSEEEIVKIVLEVIAKTGANSIKDMGAVMGKVRDQLKLSADGALISKIVKEKLTGQ